MSRIRSKDTKPELLVRHLLHKQGFRFQLHRDDLPGKPDIVLPRYKAVVMVHGCFWHAHEGHSCFKMPSTRTEWWQQKLGRNKARDWQHQRELEMLGWRVFVVWECDLKQGSVADTLQKLTTELRAETEPGFLDGLLYFSCS